MVCSLWEIHGDVGLSRALGGTGGRKGRIQGPPLRSEKYIQTYVELVNEITRAKEIIPSLEHLSHPSKFRGTLRTLPFLGET